MIALASLLLSAACVEEPAPHRVPDAGARMSVAPEPGPEDEGPRERPAAGIRLVVRVDHPGARAATTDDPAPRLFVEHAGDRTRVTARGAALPIVTNRAWTLHASASEWLEVVEGRAPDRATLRAAGPDTFAAGQARARFHLEGAPDPLLAAALAPVVALSVGGVDVGDVSTALRELRGAVRSWDVGFPRQPPVSWVVEEDARADMLIAAASTESDVPTRLGGAAGASESAADLARRFGSDAGVDDRISLTIHDPTPRMLLVYVRGIPIGWVRGGQEGRFLGIPPGRHPLRATTLRGDLAFSATVAVPGEWTAR